MQERAKQGDNLRLIFSNAPTFEEKALAFPGVTFIVGTDTLVRIQEPRYYENIEARDNALKIIKNQNNRFLVFGRKINGAFQSLDDVKLVPGLRELCTGVDETNSEQISARPNPEVTKLDTYIARTVTSTVIIASAGLVFLFLIFTFRSDG